MKIVKPNAEVLTHNIHPYAFIEKVGRTCYKSEDKIIDGSSLKFVKMMMKNSHLAMMEHEFIYFRIIYKDKWIRTTKKRKNKKLYNFYLFLKSFKYLNTVFVEEENCIFLSGSFRAFYEVFTDIPTCISKILYKNYPDVFKAYPEKSVNYDKMLFNNIKAEEIGREDMIEYAENNKEIAYYCIPHTVLFTTDRGVTHELVRHRPASFAQESTRYCNYANGRFEKEITVIKPIMFEEGTESYDEWKLAMENSEKSYMKLIDLGCIAQTARGVLPVDLKADIILTATEEEWEHIFNLRLFGTTGNPHPKMVEVMKIAFSRLLPYFTSLSLISLSDKTYKMKNKISGIESEIKF